MKVKELIAILKQFDPDKRVVIDELELKLRTHTYEPVD